MHGAEGGSRLGHVKSDAMRGLHHAAHRPVVTLPKRRKPEGRSRSGDRGVLPHTATKGFARSYRINLRLLPELAFSSGRDEIKPCGILGANDDCAIRAFHAATTAGFSIPDEVALAGIDNDEIYCESWDARAASRQTDSERRPAIPSSTKYTNTAFARCANFSRVVISQSELS